MADKPIEKYIKLFNSPFSKPQIKTAYKERDYVKKPEKKPSYTKEQWERAQANNNALEYALSQGYRLLKEGKYYRSKEHSSLVFAANGYWNWNRRGLDGDAIDFLVKVEGKTHVEAVLTLAGENNLYQKTVSVPAVTQEKRDMVLPPRAQNHKMAYAYLTQTRNISPELVQRLLHERKIYQEQSHNNVVFVGMDKDGNAKYGSMRSTKTKGKQYKFDVTGSDKSYPFHIMGKNKAVCVFEAPIDAMSYWTLCEANGMEQWKDSHMISLGGISTGALDRFLKEHPNIRNIIVCLDNDEAGNLNAQKIVDKYARKYDVKRHAPKGKDFNEVLQNMSRGSLDQKITQAQQKSDAVKKDLPAKEQRKALKQVI